MIAIWLMAGCARLPIAVQPGADWQAADLRLLDPPNTSVSDLDLIAAYARLTATDLELRVDFLGSPAPFGYDLYLAIDTEPDYETSRPLSFIPAPSWDVMLHFPAVGRSRALTSAGEPAPIRPRVLRDDLLDILTVRLSRTTLPEKLAEISFQAFVTRPGENIIVDGIGPFHLSGQPPEIEAPALLVFWEGLPAATPAQALRRWDGAHTGPFGQRHGLGVLLRVASASGLPVCILDLKAPEQLAALEVLGGLPLLHDLQRRDLLLLPDLLEEDPRGGMNILETSRRVSQQFRLAGSPFVHGPLSGNIPTGYQAAFARLADTTHLLTWDDVRLIPMPMSDSEGVESAGPEGLTLHTRRALLEAALSPEPDDLVIMGGALPSSPWGDSLVAGPAFAFLAGHPWVKVLDSRDLLNFPAKAGSPDCPDLACLPRREGSELQSDLRSSLSNSPDNLFSRIAWQMVRTLTTPVTDEDLATLRGKYLGQTGYLLSAADWYQTPRELATCDRDLDWDGDPECLLTSEETFLVFEPADARLVLAGARTNQGPIQWIGPRSQFAVGLGDPLEWRLDAGVIADPQEIPGAFSSQPDEWQEYRVQIQPGLAVFTHPLGEMRKTFQLQGTVLRIQLESSRPLTTRLPLALLDENAFKPGWYTRYQANVLADPTHISWGIRDGPTVDIHAQSAQLSLTSFAESLPYLTSPEDPNINYPQGHYIPFPLAVVDIQSEGSLVLDIRVQD